NAPVARRRRLERAGARVVPVRARAGHLDLRAAWSVLGELGVNDLLVEGGGGLAAALLAAGLGDRLHLFLAPLLIRGDGPAALAVDALSVTWVPGPSKIPFPAHRAARSGRYDGLVAIGAVVRGDTPHFEYVCQGVTDGVGRVSLAENLPIAFCVLTTETIE